jgi:F-type H+-transporting ATPase subunit b
VRPSSALSAVTRKSRVRSCRRALEQSLVDAQATEEALAKAEAGAEDILSKARAQADEALAEAKDAGSGIIAKAETAAAERAELIIKEAESRLAEERDKLRTQLRAELADLVSDATAKIIHEKLDQKRDMSLIERAIKGVTG